MGDFGGAGDVDAEVVEDENFFVGNEVSGVEFGAFEFVEVVESFFDGRVGGGTNTESEEDFAEFEVAFFKVAGLVFDFENRLENDFRDEVDFVGDFGELFQSVENDAGNRGEIAGFAAGDVVAVIFETGAGEMGKFLFFGGFFDDFTIFFADAELVHEEFDAFGDGFVDETFFQFDEGFEVAADDFVFGGGLDDFVVDDAFSYDVDAHVSGGIVDVFAEDAVENLFDDREDFEIAVVVDGADAVFF